MEILNDYWRICRVISQEGRLKLLWMLFNEGELCVTQLQLEAGMTHPNASIQLQTLRAAGLIRFRREKMNVIYRAEADGRVECAEVLLRELKRCCEQLVPFEVVIRQVTAFTHERRIEIVRALSGGLLSYNQLLGQCGMKSSALSRHLNKLEVRGFVEQREGLYRLARPSGRLGQKLLKIARSC